VTSQLFIRDLLQEHKVNLLLLLVSRLARSSCFCIGPHPHTVPPISRTGTDTLDSQKGHRTQDSHSGRIWIHTCSYNTQCPLTNAENIRPEMEAEEEEEVVVEAEAEDMDRGPSSVQCSHRPSRMSLVVPAMQPGLIDIRVLINSRFWSLTSC